MARSHLAAAVRELPAGATVCGWCAEFEDAARRATDLAYSNDDLRRENERLRNNQRKNTSDEVERLRDELRYALRDSVYYREKDHPFRCPLCEWVPKDDAPHPLRSLRMHLNKAHQARRACGSSEHAQTDDKGAER